jgi:hypothetical protein
MIHRLGALGRGIITHHKKEARHRMSHRASDFERFFGKIKAMENNIIFGI